MRLSPYSGPLSMSVNGNDQTTEQSRAAQRRQIGQRLITVALSDKDRGVKLLPGNVCGRTTGGRVPTATRPIVPPLSSLLQPLTPSPAPGRDEVVCPDAGPGRSRLVFLGNIFGRIAPIGQGIALPDQPAIQVGPVRRVANAERPVIAVLALNRAGDRARADLRPQRLGGALTTPVALTGRLPTGLLGICRMRSRGAWGGRADGGPF